jgi:hypothetical protein
VALPGAPTLPFFWLAAILMNIGVWLQLTEIHEHEALNHAHIHVHGAPPAQSRLFLEPAETP